ncbi:MAG: glycosyltransferase 87 family protein [Gaiellaceae bacterium]
MAGVAVAVLVAGASLAAWPGSSPLVPRHGGHPGGDSFWAWLFLGCAAGALLAYVVGLRLLERRGAALRTVAIVAAAVQLVPLGAPLLLSTDAWTYWSYARIAVALEANPYVDTPGDFPDDVALPHVGTAWRDTPSIYGSGFTLASELVARAAGRSEDAAAWAFKALAALAVLAATLAAVRLAERKPLACAFAGWNPVVALHAAGGGHNDAWVAALLVGGLALAAAGRRQLGGAAWAGAILVKWVPLVLLPLHLAGRDARRRFGAFGLAAALVLLGALSTWRYGLGWLRALEPVARKAGEQTSVALPSRLADLGMSRALAAGVLAVGFAAAYVLLLRQAARGHARLALASALFLLASPWLVVWYLPWSVALAAAEEDRTARWLTIALSAYLLPQAVPL